VGGGTGGAGMRLAAIAQARGRGHGGQGGSGFDDMMGGSMGGVVSSDITGINEEEVSSETGHFGAMAEAEEL